MNSSSGEGQVIVVYWANYGRRDNTTCPDGNTAQLQNVTCLTSADSPLTCIHRCNWQNSCTVEAKTSVFGDPCGGTYKYLEVVYDCQSKSLKDKQTTSKNNSTSSLSNIKPVIVVSWANFGRRDNTTCPDASADSPLTCIHRCNWQNSCTVEAKTSVFGDPCGGTYKYLEVVYDCQSKSLKDKQTTSKNNSTSSLSNIKPV
uniref:SUEL-type lectin domain-containing protein n=1 Tax=Oreochromis niloticus TaxID=8128 RepID=A0A669BNA2_ORENI